MIKKTVKKEKYMPVEVDVEVFEANDGTQFETEKLALEYEKLMGTKQIDIKSNIINNGIALRDIGEFKLIYFQNENQIEAYEQKMCNGDNKTWGSWPSCQEKFIFPCWIVCRYEELELADEESYIANYLTLDEFKEDLKNVLKQIDIIST